DGIRDFHVTGVQTCALPICSIKHPGNVVPANPAPFQNGATIRLDDWPVAGGVLDDISAWFQIDWQYNGQSLGNVEITNIGVNDRSEERRVGKEGGCRRSGER